MSGYFQKPFTSSSSSSDNGDICNEFDCLIKSCNKGLVFK